MENKFQSERLRQARFLKKLTLEELASEVDVSKQSLSFYEGGERVPSANTLFKISRALEMPFQFFSKPLGPLEAGSRSAINYRSLERARKVAKERYRSSTIISLSAALFDVLNEHVAFKPANVPVLVEEDVDLNQLTESDIEGIALELRSEWGLGQGPISDLTLLVENNSIPVISTALPDNMDGLSGWFNSRPFIVSSSSASYFRARMNVAHELGHLVLHRSVSTEQLANPKFFKLIEKQAWRFAGAFLMPASTFSSEVYSISLDGLLILKRRWGASVAAMVSRLSNLGAIDEQKRRYLHVQISQRKWRKEEPYDRDTEVERSRLLNQVVNVLHESGQMLIEDIASISGLPIWFLTDALNTPESKLLGQQIASNVIRFRVRETG